MSENFELWVLIVVSFTNLVSLLLGAWITQRISKGKELINFSHKNKVDRKKRNPTKVKEPF